MYNAYQFNFATDKEVKPSHIMHIKLFNPFNSKPMKTIISKVAFIATLIFSIGSSAQIQNGAFKLIDANTDIEIRTFTSDITHYLSEADSLNIVAEPSGSYTHVKFFTSDGYDRQEGTAPYAYYGDVNGDYGQVPGYSIYFGWAPTVGTLDFTVEYINNGTVVNTDTFTITFEQEPPPPSAGGAWNQNGANINYNSGNVGIGTSSPDAPLSVKGRIHAEEVKVDLSVPAPDYVFKENYHLKTLEEVGNHIDEYGHLPNIPSALEMETNGIDLGTMEMRLLEKIEELTLYIIEHDSNQKRHDLKQKQLENRIMELEKNKLGN